MFDQSWQYFCPVFYADFCSFVINPGIIIFINIFKFDYATVLITSLRITPTQFPHTVILLYEETNVQQCKMGSTEYELGSWEYFCLSFKLQSFDQCHFWQFLFKYEYRSKGIYK